MEGSVVLELQGEGRSSLKDHAGTGLAHLVIEAPGAPYSQDASAAEDSSDLMNGAGESQGAPAARKFLKKGNGRLASHLVPRPSAPAQQLPKQGKRPATRSGHLSQRVTKSASGVGGSVQRGVPHEEESENAKASVKEPVLKASPKESNQRPLLMEASSRSSLVQKVSPGGSQKVALALQETAAGEAMAADPVHSKEQVSPLPETSLGMQPDKGLQSQGGARVTESGGGSRQPSTNPAGLASNPGGYPSSKQRRQSQGGVQSQSGVHGRMSGGGSQKVGVNRTGSGHNLGGSGANPVGYKQRQKPAWDERFWKTADSGTSVMVAGVSGQWLYRQGERTSNDGALPAGSKPGVPGGRNDRGVGGMSGKLGRRLAIAAAVARRDVLKLAEKRDFDAGWEHQATLYPSSPAGSAPREVAPETVQGTLRVAPERVSTTQNNSKQDGEGSIKPQPKPSAPFARSGVPTREGGQKAREARSFQEPRLPQLPREDTSHKQVEVAARLLSPGPYPDSERPPGSHPRSAFGGTPLSALLERSGGLGKVLSAAAASLDQEAGRVVAASRRRRTSGIGIKSPTVKIARAEPAAGATSLDELAALHAELARETALAEGLGRLTESVAHGGFRAGIERLQRHLAGEPSPAELRADLRQLAEASLGTQEGVQELGGRDFASDGEGTAVRAQERRGREVEADGMSSAVRTQELGRRGIEMDRIGTAVGVQELGQRRMERGVGVEGTDTPPEGQELGPRIFEVDQGTALRGNEAAEAAQTSARGPDDAGERIGGQVTGHGGTRVGTGEDGEEAGMSGGQGTWSTWQQWPEGNDPALRAALYLRQLREAEELEDALRAKWLAHPWPVSLSPPANDVTRPPTTAARILEANKSAVAPLEELASNRLPLGDGPWLSKPADVAEILGTREQVFQAREEVRGGGLDGPKARPMTRVIGSSGDSGPRGVHPGIVGSLNGMRDGAPLEEILGVSADSLLEWCNKYVDELVDSEFRTPPVTPRTTLQGPHGPRVKGCAA